MQSSFQETVLLLSTGGCQSEHKIKVPCSCFNQPNQWRQRVQANQRQSSRRAGEKKIRHLGAIFSFKMIKPITGIIQQLMRGFFNDTAVTFSTEKVLLYSP